MPNLNEGFPGKYLKAADLAGKAVTLTITNVIFEPVGPSGERKLQVFFAEQKKIWVCNRTNSKTISKVYGGDTEDWIGKQIVLFPTTTTFGGETVDCIRVKAPPAGGAAPAAAAAPPAAAAATTPSRDEMNDDIPW